MRTFIIAHGCFTFGGRQSGELEILGKSILKIMQSALHAEQVTQLFAEEYKGEDALFLYPCFPFLSKDVLEEFCSAHTGSFRFQGGFLLRNGECINKCLPTVSVHGIFGPAVFSLVEYVNALTYARRMQMERFIKMGVLVEDGASIDYGVIIGKGSYVGKNAVLSGACIVGENVSIGANCYLHESCVGDGTQIEHSTIVQSKIGSGCAVGPYARLRPNCEVGNGCRIGNFVELKEAKLGDGCKVSHLAYVGNATLKERVNVGCGVVFVNYNGVCKQRSEIGSDCFIGSNCNIIAPVTLENGVFVAAGTTVTQSLRAYDFCIGRVRETIKSGGAIKYKKG